MGRSLNVWDCKRLACLLESPLETLLYPQVQLIVISSGVYDVWAYAAAAVMQNIRQLLHHCRKLATCDTSTLSPFSRLVLRVTKMVSMTGLDVLASTGQLEGLLA